MSARQIQERLRARADAARVPVLQGYFNARLPRTMLRCAIERFAEAEHRRCLKRSA